MINKVKGKTKISPDLPEEQGAVGSKTTFLSMVCCISDAV